MIDQPKAPIIGWRYIGEVDMPGEKCHMWIRDPIGVLSAFGDMEYRGVVVPHFHVSASIPKQNRRPNDEEMAIVRADFDMKDAEEDNHSPGIARHLFRPVHLPHGTVGICDCKENEEIVTEPDGFQWTRPKAKSNE